MPIIIYNASWMTFNSFLAITPVLFCWLFLHSKNILYKILLGILWILFLPNSIYTFTDLTHLLEQWSKVSSLDHILLVFQYSALVYVGLTAFILALYPLEIIISQNTRKKEKQLEFILIFELNFLIGLAMVLGKVERINSWDLFTATEQVFSGIFHILTSVELLLLTLLFGLFVNFFYFLFRKPVISYFFKNKKPF